MFIKNKEDYTTTVVALLVLVGVLPIFLLSLAISLAVSGGGGGGDEYDQLMRAVGPYHRSPSSLT